MNLRLTPMLEDEFKNFLEDQIAGYAQENVRAGYWHESNAWQRSREAVERLLPQGLKTPNHYLFVVRIGERRVGIIWMRITVDLPVKQAFIFDIEIDKAERGKGYGKATMILIEEKAKELGQTQMGLHVFAHNMLARSLYEGLGYRVTSLNMIKDIE